MLRKFTKHSSRYGKLTSRFFSCPAKPSTETDGSPPKANFQVKPFDSIPGPKSLPIIGTLYKYIPYLGEFRIDKLHENGLKRLRKYGPLVREDMRPGVSMVFIYTPEDLSTLYECEGKYPSRRSHPALEKYRADRPHIYNNGGLIVSEGEVWYRMRLACQKNLSRIEDVHSRLPSTDTITREFIQSAIRPSEITDFMPNLSRLYLELIYKVLFYHRLQSFSEPELVADSVSSQLINATLNISFCMMKTSNGPQLWRYWRTPVYRKFENLMAVLEKQAIEMVDKTRPGENSSLVSQYLTNVNLDKKDIYCMAIDAIMGGVDTSLYTTCFILYNLANNPKVQEQLYEEACRILPSPGDSLTVKHMDEIKLTRAVVRETFRLNPPSVGVGRVLAKDAVMSGYKVPAGTIVITQNQVSCRLEEYFPRPNEFIPERHMKDSPEYQKYHRRLIMPFGFGVRSCIARYSAEQNIYVLLLRLIREYKFKYHGGKMNVRTVVANQPDQPLLLSFTKRHT